ncbi:hypothetical protein VTN31DRAFT_1841 [Thermomyces dupontii]|uniref:uncharacterized protein n=1 Tax=Talaromyces thermophilus TaxID=28565 RepID=UPI003742C5DE
MSSDSGLSPPGSSTYASDTMYVGDGTWDSTRNTFLLPNLMGLNFETMRYNGMGNRFRYMPGYRSLIIAHGVIAAIVFLGLVPVAVLIARYYSRRNRYMAIKYHAWLQVLTLFLSTVVFVTGWFAVGPRRSLTNPHHGIGLAIYVLVIFQVLWGWLSRKSEKGKVMRRVPLKLVVHRWIGRALAILGIVQIPLGLTLYGSPKSLFILFSIAGFAWLAFFFVLSYRYDENPAYFMSSEYDGSYVSGPSVAEDRQHGRVASTAAAAAAGAGLASLFGRRSRARSEEPDDSSYYYSEKYSDEGGKSKWGKRILQLGALGGAAALAKTFFDRRRDRERDDESGRYRQARTRSDSMTEETMSRTEEGRTAPRRQGPYMHPGRQPSHSSIDYTYGTLTDDYTEPSRRGPSVRDVVPGGGIFATIRRLFSRRDDEQRRVEEIRRRDIEEERLQRANSKRRYTGDGFYPQRQRQRQPSAMSSDMVSDMTPETRRPGTVPAEGTEMSGAVTADTADAPPATPTHRRRPSGGAMATDTEAESGAAMEATPSQPPHRRSSSSRRRTREDVSSPPISLQVKMHDDGRHVTLRRLTEEEAAANREARRRERERRRSRRRGSASSLSGTEYTSTDRWRRVEEAERRQAEEVRQQQEAAAAAAPSAAAESAATPVPAPAPAPPVPPSASAQPPEPSGPPYPVGPSPHQPPSAGTPSNITMPAPPPPPSHSQLPYGASSIVSPGTYTGTYTGTDASLEYASNRRRRRAERARARQQQQQHSVEFT